ncbi:transposase [Nonomuraea sp. NPDC052265]|uniref:transposase n=1 Tax=Nonomuraea sp. NPDC052265 TaxID=3364374 RepID=UPI0037C66F90
MALLSVLPFTENLSDRKAVEAVRAQIDWMHALGLELTDPGVGRSVSAGAAASAGPLSGPKIARRRFRQQHGRGGVPDLRRGDAGRS